jgi:hypothetical protein
VPLWIDRRRFQKLGTAGFTVPLRLLYFPSRRRENALELPSPTEATMAGHPALPVRAIRYEAEGEPVGAVDCHCRDCQYVSGGGPAHMLVMAASNVRMTRRARFISASRPGIRWAAPLRGLWNAAIRPERGTAGLSLDQGGTLDDPLLYREGS